MKQVSEVGFIDPLRDARWDTFVENHPFGWVCHLSGWKVVLEKSFKHVKGHYFCLFRGDTIQAALPLFEVSSWLTGKRLVSIPFATLSDPLVSTDQEMKALSDAATRFLRKRGAAFMEIRTLHSPAIIDNGEFGVHDNYQHHYLSLENHPDALKKSFDRTCVRQRINRSIKSDLKLHVVENESGVRVFYRLYVLTRKRQGLPPQPFIFFRTLWETFAPSEKLTILIAEQRGNPVAGLSLLKFKNRVSAEFAASDDKYKNASPNHFLFWEAIKDAYDRGFSLFDFGRTSRFNKSLMDFKNRWGTKIQGLPHFYYPRDAVKKNDNRERSMGFKVINTICNNAPDFAMRQIGNFCYRHLG